eukprot:2664-Heterococcus_DN1.PRE.2
MTAVLPNGDIIKTGGRAKKSAAGYDLTRLLVGSEGTLAVITEITLKVFKVRNIADVHNTVPSYSVGMRVSFDSIGEASAVVQETLAAGIQFETHARVQSSSSTRVVIAIISELTIAVAVGRAEMMDNNMMKIINVANGTQHIEATTVLFEFAGESQAAVLEMQEKVAAIAKAHSPLAMSVATDTKACKQMWMERKEALWSAQAQYPDMECMITDHHRIAAVTSATNAAVSDERSNCYAMTAGFIAYTPCRYCDHVSPVDSVIDGSF